jgi:hypothetical protein
VFEEREVDERRLLNGIDRRLVDGFLKTDRLTARSAMEPDISVGGVERTCDAKAGRVEGW